MSTEGMDRFHLEKFGDTLRPSFGENGGQIFWGRGTLAVSPTCGAKWRTMYIARFSPPWAVKNGVENFSISTSGLELWASEMWQVCAKFNAL